MRASARDEGMLSFYFGGDRLFYRSSMGGQLAAAQAASADSAGRRIGRPLDWTWLPWRESKFADQDRPLPTFVPKHSGGSAGYEIDRGDVLFHARISRRVGTVAQIDPRAHRILAEVYGDRGARWAALSADRRNEEGTVFTAGIGPGSIAALFELTVDGRALLEHERSLTAAHHDNKARALDAKKARATKVQLEQRRAELAAAIEQAEQEASRLSKLYDAALDAANQAAAEHTAAKAAGTATSTTRARLAAAKEALALPLDALEDVRRTLVLLRRQLAHTGAAPALTNPVCDPSVKEAFEAVRAANAARDDVLRQRARLRAELEATDGAPLAADDPRLPAVPDPVELPALPVPTLPTLPRAAAEHLTNDELLQNALVVQRTRPDALRAARLARAQEAAQKLLQYALGAWLASQPKSPPKGNAPRDAAFVTAAPDGQPATRQPPATYRARPVPVGEQRSIKGHVRPGYGRVNAPPAAEGGA